MVWSPLAGGLLTGKYDEGTPAKSRGARTSWLDEDLTEGNRVRLREFTGIAREMGAEPGQLAIAWLLARPAVSSVILGASSPDQVRSNVQALDLRIPPDVRRRIERLFSA
jgi:L-glyceraldehyde 3-phosphate reductase